MTRRAGAPRRDRRQGELLLPIIGGSFGAAALGLDGHDAPHRDEASSVAIEHLRSLSGEERSLLLDQLGVSRRRRARLSPDDMVSIVAGAWLAMVG